VRFSGRAPAQVELVEAYAREQGMFHDASTKEAAYTTVLDLDLASVEPSVAGPKRAQDRVSLFSSMKSFEEALPSLVKPK
jgi:aconitate hydratase